MEANDRKLMQIKALLTNTIAMLLYLLTAITALAWGFYFFFMTNAAGYAIGIAMFCLSGLLFLIGEIRYFVTMRRIKEDVYD